MLNRHQIQAVGLLALLFLVYGVARAQEEQGKPEGGYGSAVELRRFIQVRGVWRENGYTITAVKPGGPATKMKSEDGDTHASMEPGDRVVEVEGTKIKSYADYAKAMNGATDPQHIKMKVWDMRSGKVYTWYVGSKDSPHAD